MKYSQSTTQQLNDKYQDNPAADIDAYQHWANDMAQYPKRLTGNDTEMATDLAHGSQEIVYLLEYATNDQSPISDEKPPALWIKRYNDIREEFKLVFIAFESECQTAGTTKPTDQSTSTAASATAMALSPAPAATGIKKPLQPSQLASIFGDTDFTPTEQITDVQPLDGQDFDPPDCAALGTVGATFSYLAPGRGHMAGNWNRGARGEMAAQLITAWQNPTQAQTVVAQSRYEWGFCTPERPFTVTSHDGTQKQLTQWMPPDWVRDNSKTHVSSTSIIRLPEPAQRTCGHVMTSQGNIVVEAIACGDGNTDQTDQQVQMIVDQILYDP